MAENEGTTGEGTATGTSTGEGQQAPAWTAQLPESLRSNPDVTSFKSIGELGQSFLDTSGRAREFETKAQENEGKVKDYETRIASEFIPRLKDTATDEQKAAYYKALGRPDTAEAYVFPKVDLPAALATPELAEAEKAFRADCFAAGIPAREAGFLYKNFLGRQVSVFNANETAKEQRRQDAILSLKTEWGGRFDENAAVADRAMNKYLTPEAKSAIEAAGLGNNPAIAKLFHAIGVSIKDDVLIRGVPMKPENEAREPGKLRYPSMEKEQ